MYFSYKIQKSKGFPVQKKERMVWLFRKDLLLQTLDTNIERQI